MTPYQPKTCAGGRDLTIIITLYGQPGIAVVQTIAMDSEVSVLGFASNRTKDPDAFVVVNLGNAKKVNVRVKGSAAKAFNAFRTTEDQKETFTRVGAFLPNDRALICEVPGGSVSTFFADEP